MNSTVRIISAKTYSCHAKIESAVIAALEMDIGALHLIENRTRDRLIVIKPNWIQEAHEYKPDVWEPVITNPELVICILEYLAGSIRTGTTIFLATLRNRNLCLSGKSFPSATEGIILYLRTMKSPDHPKLARRAEK